MHNSQLWKITGYTFKLIRFKGIKKYAVLQNQISKPHAIYS